MAKRTALSKVEIRGPRADTPLPAGSALPTAGDLTTVRLLARARKLEWLTIGWLVLEAGVAIIAALAARSVALLGFGLDSLIELCSALVVLWRVSAARRASEAAERTAQRLIAACFAGLSAYLAIDATHSLITGASPRITWAGLTISAAALVVMPLLGRAKRRVARQLQSAAVRGDAAQSWLCALTAGAALCSIAIHALLGWNWIDPLAALLIAALAAREAREAWNGEGCGECSPAASAHATAPLVPPALEVRHEGPDDRVRRPVASNDPSGS
jgi:Co/Zn/Cd efflux system component